jgi:hypothetical protein
LGLFMFKNGPVFAPEKSSLCHFIRSERLSAGFDSPL